MTTEKAVDILIKKGCNNDDANRIDQCEELLAELKKLRKSAKQRVYRLRSQW